MTASSPFNATTKLCMIVGSPVSHSLSPVMHNTAYRALGIEDKYVYLASEVAKGDLERVVAGVRSMGIRGLTCTIPHKQDILPFLDDIEPMAQRLGAVNTVVQSEDGQLTGYNTDWLGIIRPLLRTLNASQDDDAALAGNNIAILGAGGTARAAAWGVQSLGGTPSLFNRTLEKAEQLAQEVGCAAYSLQAHDMIHDADIIINTTSVGMPPMHDASPLPSDCLRPTQIIMDAIYTPFETVLLRQAKDKGARLIRGAQMFLEQGVEQFSLYTERDAPRDVMADVICQHFGVSSL
ncbi:MAG TPA: shikimate dehydrogenase [Myxococcales bacterium]|nr:shikimate dehydrogenase [Deltaproteobacteria bacterium]HAA55174.1 shikimate dehydrogenase [Myxococcales bacterium]|tara:strand:- start:16900 stop:17778 length:879 start_codon:yes stop_codon:yes gene_type:complete